MYPEVEFDSKFFKDEGCFEPVKVYSKDLKRYILVPCGHCLVCLRRRQSEWVARLVEHLKEYPNNSYFVTLTYSDDNLPIDEDFGVCVSRDHIKKLNRDLRKRFQQGFFMYENDSDLGKVSEKIELPDLSFKYYVTSEYSPVGRPHYHAVYFNLPHDRYLVSLLFESVWKKGMVRCFPASPESIGYITKYLVNSKVTGSYDPEEMIHPFSMMSKGLGLSYVSRMYSYHLDDPEKRYSFSQVHGSRSSMPRYWRDKIFPEAFRKEMYSKFLNVRDLIQEKIDNSIHSSEENDRYSKAREKYQNDQYYAARQVALRKQHLK